MAREVLYRRSFHAERDLKVTESLIGLDHASFARKVSVDTRVSTSDGGFEAPRNSLDVPFSGLLELRRNSEVRIEEIPVGYELSRSITTTRKRNEECSNFKPLTSTNDQSRSKSKYRVPKVNLELDQQHRAPSVVARLMGLDALPHQEDLEGSNHPLLRRILPQECIASSKLTTLAFERDISVEDHSKEKLGYEELSFRNHPQEKQLQEFKREFMARQGLQERHSMACLNVEGFTLQQKKEQLLRLESQMDSDEFLDALDFLNANKDFFVKVLNDPQSSFAKHLHQLGSSIPRSSSEPRPRSFTDDLAAWKKKQYLHQCSATEKSKALRSSRWGRDEEMPGRPQWRARGGSAQSSGRMRLDQSVPTRIVVLKPNLGKQAYNRKPSSMLNSSSPLLHPNEMFKVRCEGKENVKQEMKERTQLRNDVGLAKEYFRDEKDGAKDARVIAKQIVKHVKEDMSQRLVNDGPNIMNPLVPVSCSNGRKALVQKVGGDGSSIIDREGYYRTLRDNGKLCSSLLSLPHPSKNDREGEHQQSGFNGRSGSHSDETKRSSHKHLSSSSKCFREPSKVDEGGMVGSLESSVKQSVRDSKVLRKTGRSNSFKIRESKCEAPKVLSRSLSAPAAASIGSGALESEQRGGATTLERAACPIKARPVENSPFKERLLSLKDSFSLTKRRGSKKLSSPPCSTPLDLSDLSPPRQLALEPVGAISVERKEPCHSLAGFEWQAVSSADGMAKEIADKSMDEVLSDNSRTPPGIQQWTSIADLVDTASESSVDKCEQPSPVSVLEVPFQEESPGSVDKKKMDSKCHERRCELSRLNSDKKDLPRNLYSQFFSPAPFSCHPSFGSSADESLNAWNLPEAHLESHSLCDATCTSGSEEERTYIMHILILSGLNMNGLIMAHSPSSEHGLSPSLFGRLEAYYEKGSKRDEITPLNLSSRRLLFDVVDEVVASVLKKPLFQPWAKSSNQKIYLCTGKQLLEQILDHIKYHRFAPSEGEDEVLEDMAAKDLMREMPWARLQSDTQSVVIELERLISGDLIREIVHECVKRR